VGDPLFLKKNKRKQMTRHLLFADFGDQSLLENQGFFNLKNIFYSKHPENTLITLINLSMATQKTRKTKINPKLKLFSWTDLSPWARRREKNLGQTPLMKWNLLTLKLTIFMARIVINDDFLSLL